MIGPKFKKNRMLIVVCKEPTICTLHELCKRHLYMNISIWSFCISCKQNVGIYFNLQRGGCFTLIELKLAK